MVHLRVAFVVVMALSAGAPESHAEKRGAKRRLSPHCAGCNQGSRPAAERRRPPRATPTAQRRVTLRAQPAQPPSAAAPDVKEMKLATSKLLTANGLGTTAMSDAQLGTLAALYRTADAGHLAELRQYLAREAELSEGAAQLTKDPADAQYAADLRRVVEQIDGLRH
jgi:hypothetical protein